MMDWRQRVWRFGWVGVTGFVVDSGVVYLLKGPFGLYGARAISFVCAVLTTWLLNRRWTFHDRSSGHPRSVEALIYLLLMLGGGAVNLSVYAVMVWQLDRARSWPVLAVAAGSVAGLGVNLLTSRWGLFRHPGARTG